jgi:hypothetical protein
MAILLHWVCRQSSLPLPSPSWLAGAASVCPAIVQIDRLCGCLSIPLFEEPRKDGLVVPGVHYGQFAADTVHVLDLLVPALSYCVHALNFAITTLSDELAYLPR